jgi:F-type H+-transporting ATPase subunit alpha
VPINKVKQFEAEYVALLEAQHKGTLDSLRSGKIDDAVTAVLEKVASELVPKYKA